ncbi:inactive tyrosine-protein kinase 7-like [Branchiostoma floridae]|uniref:Soluble interferon alpha/beta receptor OPG204 n=1 Tax=Branchiostoma floridae TaxID=7739 RepID=A0A9J7MBV0_BRAFL|nr:inactive tyrosine-protein kinase 7-like [Branchiostoma floridae]
MRSGNGMWLCLVTLSLLTLNSSCVSVGPPPTEPSFLASTAADDYYYDYYSYYGNDYSGSGYSTYTYDYGTDEPCHSWQDKIQELHYERAVNTEFIIITCPYHECWEFDTTTWYKEGVRYKWKNTELIQQTGDKREKLDFRKVYRDDAGNYTCEMTNGTHTYTAKIQLTTRDPESMTAPIMQPITPTIAYRHPADNATFLCQANFGVVGPAHFPQLYWTKNNTFVDSSKMILHRRIEKDGSLNMNNTLSLTDVREDDFGEYICIAHTTFGWAQENATLVNGDPPVDSRTGSSTTPTLRPSRARCVPPDGGCTRRALQNMGAGDTAHVEGLLRTVRG